jgi:hypothetical protein
LDVRRRLKKLGIDGKEINNAMDSGIDGLRKLIKDHKK